ncbi:hypothetical protein O3M35_006190 [Rhynocoris fuscipes]|uniref:Uncharacterized protein n=1 Tax=Rhynocoris fuscipes TaxID=488301 RepID=A0AAW1DE46_9HEMI
MGEGTRDSEENSSTQKEDNSFSPPALTQFPKRFDDSQDNQDDLRNTPDIPNGHNNPDAVDIAPRTKSLDELLQESEGLPDTELTGCTKDFVESKMDTPPAAVTEEVEKKDNVDKTTVEDSDKKDPAISTKDIKDVVKTDENDKESEEGNNERLFI